MPRPLRALSLPLAVALILTTGCDRTDPASNAPTRAAEGSDANANANAVSVSEQHTEQLVEIARGMRDVDANLAWPVPDAFWAEVRRRRPAKDPAGDITLDGWQRPLLYVRPEMRSFRLYSAGPNGRDEYGHGDDVALRQGETLIE